MLHLMLHKTRRQRKKKGRTTEMDNKLEAMIRCTSGGLSFYTSDKNLRAVFEVKVIMDKISKRSKGYAFVEYTTEEGCNCSTEIDEWQGSPILEREKHQRGCNPITTSVDQPGTCWYHHVFCVQIFGCVCVST
ncbi:Glycine-rich RNA-binding protein mitochondrial-like [Quillaja saponaria]|uniref:Glycine-rich RNA-binding protein mitochondrial-like n=1 Tax=Quillaja saponaria TaxID=32244 RepID=A0AAD7Q4U8_QUISA|nr:Glycine-rich RNA-binding protein mitochondrial-like [Quillaja saponaria]